MLLLTVILLTYDPSFEIFPSSLPNARIHTSSVLYHGWPTVVSQWPRGTLHRSLKPLKLPPASQPKVWRSNIVGEQLFDLQPLATRAVFKIKPLSRIVVRQALKLKQVLGRIWSIEPGFRAALRHWQAALAKFLRKQ